MEGWQQCIFVVVGLIALLLLILIPMSFSDLDYYQVRQSEWLFSGFDNDQNHNTSRASSRVLAIIKKLGAQNWQL